MPLSTTNPINYVILSQNSIMGHRSFMLQGDPSQISRLYLELSPFWLLFPSSSSGCGLLKAPSSVSSTQGHVWAHPELSCPVLRPGNAPQLGSQGSTKAHLTSPLSLSDHCPWFSVVSFLENYFFNVFCFFSCSRQKGESGYCYSSWLEVDVSVILDYPLEFHYHRHQCKKKKKRPWQRFEEHTFLTELHFPSLYHILLVGITETAFSDVIHQILLV